MDKLNDTLSELKEQNQNLLEWKRKLSLILEYSGKISAATDLSEILKVITDETKDVLQADRCSVFLVDKKKDELFSWVAHGLGKRQIRFPKSTGLAGTAVVTGETINVKDAYNDERFNPEIDQKTGYFTKTILCIPMKNRQGETIGVFQVLNKLDGVFAEQDAEMLRLLATQAAGIIENAMLYEEMKKSFKSFINTLAEAVDARDPLTAGHSSRVCSYAVLIAQKMGYSEKEIERLQYAALLHDLGKIGVKEGVLTKPGRLDEKEYSHIQTHTSVTRKILEQTYFKKEFKDIPLMASSHHEKVDGTGYPQNLKGEKIPEVSRIMAIADVFDALTSKRHYRGPMPLQKVFSILKEETGRKFDPVCMEAFFKLDLWDVMKVMFEREEKPSSETVSAKLKGVTLQELLRKFQDGVKDDIIENVAQYYSRLIDEG